MRLALVSFCAIIVLSAFTASPALAGRSFDSQITEANSAVLKKPSGLAVDSSDHLWVSDTGTSLLSEFDSSGAYLAQNDGSGSWSGSPYITSAAFGKTSNLVYVADYAHDDLWGINPAGATYASVDLHEGLGGGCCVISIAVDNSGTATDGDIYVAGGGTSLQRIDSSGNPANFTSGSAAGKNVLDGADTPTGSFNARNVAVDSQGNFYVANPYHAVVYKFAPSGSYLQTFDGTGAPGGFSGAGGFTGLQGVAIDPTNDNVLVVDHGKGVVDEFDSTGVYLGQLKGTGPSEGTPFANLNGGIAVNSAGFVYVADEGSHAIDIFTPAVILPTLTYGPITNETHTSGTVNALVDPNGGPEITSCKFQYGTSSSYGSTVPCSPATPYMSNISVSADLSGLTPETTYHYRLVLTTDNGTRNGADQTYTPRAVHGVSTDSASEISASSVRLNGSFNGEGEDVRYYFEWSEDSSLSNHTAVPPGVLVQAPTGAQSVGAGLVHLQPDTVYRFRLIVSDSFGTTVGSTQTFTTLGRNQFSTYIGSPGPGDGQLENPKDVAVHLASGDIYVADTGNHRVVKFNSAGDFVSAWGGGVGGGVGSEVCTSGCVAGLSGGGAGQFEAPHFIEVDNSGGPSDGDVYVGDGNRGDVQKFDPSGDLIESWGENGAVEFAGGDGPIQGITVDDQGSLFVAAEDHWTEIGQDGVFRQRISTGFYAEHSLGGPNGQGIDIDSRASFYQATSGGVDIAPPSIGDRIERDFTPGNPTGLAVDRSTGDLYVDHGSFVYQFLASDECFPSNGFGVVLSNCRPADSFGTGDLDGASGLAVVPSTGVVYAANSGDDNIAVFTPLPLPEVVTKAASAVDADVATLNGHVDPGGSATITDCYFEYGTDPSLAAGTVPCAQSLPIVGEADVSAELTGLSPFTSYRYRLVATRSDGEGLPARGSQRTVTPLPSKPPSVDGTDFSDVTETSARLSAIVNPNLAPTTYVFQYGPTSRYGSNTPISAPIGEDASSHPVSVSIAGLDPGTDYHFRVVAVNLSGTTPGADMTFTTPSSQAPPTSPAHPGQPAMPPGHSIQEACTKLAQRAAGARRKASLLRLRAKRASDPDRAGALRAQAKQAAREAQGLSRKTAACEGKSKVGGR